jgi:phosphonate transport system substrate-binding protein
MKVITIIISLIILFSFPAHARDIRIGLIPEQNVFKQVRRYRPLGDYIEAKTGLKIKFTILSRYGNIIKSFHSKKLDGAFWGSFTGAMAIRRLGIQPIARPVNPDGSSTYHGYILVRKNSNIRSVADMKNRTIAFVEKATTAGYIFPLAFLRRNGVKIIDGYFKEYYFTGSHDAAINALLSGDADIACAKNTVYEIMAEKDPRLQKDLLILARSPDVPSNGLGLRRDMQFSIKSDIKKTILEMHKDPDGRKVLKEFGVLRFIETTREDYQPVFEIAEDAGINLKEYQYINE